MEKNAQDNWWAESKGNLTDYKPLSLPGSTVTKFVMMASLLISALFSIKLIEGIWMGYDLGGFFNDVLPILSIVLAIGYLCFSFRIVISRNQDTAIIHRQFILPQFQFFRRVYPVHSMTADQVTYSGGEDGNSTTYTTLYSGEEVVLKYMGHKRKLKRVLPELLD